MKRGRRKGRDFGGITDVMEIISLYTGCVMAAFSAREMPADLSIVPTIPQSVRADALRRLFKVAYDMGRRELLEDLADDGK